VNAAELFRIFCSNCTLLGASEEAFLGGRVITMSKSAGNNGLQKYGMSYFELCKLVEYGLINPDFAAYTNFASSVMAKGGTEIMPVRLAGNLCVLKRDDDAKRPELLRLSGPGLTQAGSELAGIVEVQRNDAYLVDLQTHLMGLGYRLTPCEIRNGQLFVASIP